MKRGLASDTQNVGIIVPLPNHYSSDMPQGHGVVRNTNRATLFILITIQYNTAMREKQKSEDEEQIKLKPIAGIRPGVYLTALYSLILLIILFFLLVFPGLRNPGAMLMVKTEPQGAAVRIDGVYMGVSGSKIFVPKGARTIEAVLPGFESESAVHQISGRVFGSLFFPTIYKTTFTLKTADPAAAFALSAADFAAWSFAGEPTSIWQIPLSLSEGAYRIGSESDPSMQEILLAASRFTATRAGLRDLVRAKALLDNNGGSPSPSGLLGSVSDILAFLSENPGSAEWLSNILPSESSAIVEASAWYKNETPTTLSPSNVNFPFPSRLALAGLTFTNINNFMISENPVPSSIFETFLNENPEWKEHKTDYYPDQLSVYPSETYGRETITGVSWFAAEAFCKWLTARLPSSMAGMEVRLPTETEWEFAELNGVIKMGNSGWEWCADPFAPLQFITAPSWAVQTVGSPERSLRGRPSASSTENRASLPPDFSSPFVTFRPVIAQRGN